MVPARAGTLARLRRALPCLPDLNGDGFVNGLDLGLLLSQWSL
jgi:hypothetical protein